LGPLRGRRQRPRCRSATEQPVDPLTAVLFFDCCHRRNVVPRACRRTLPIFDGHQRYDLKLAFKHMDKVTAEKGYAGPVVVCSVSYEPIAGHASIPLSNIFPKAAKWRWRSQT
jgi:Protein of unknown function (DUF3108)